MHVCCLNMAKTGFLCDVAQVHVLLNALSFPGFFLKMMYKQQMAVYKINYL